MLSNLKYALRQSGKNPGFTAVVALILALGIGSNTAVFTAINVLLIRGLPVRNPQELVLLGVSGIQHISGRLQNFSYPLYQEFRDHAQSLSGVVADNTADLKLSMSGPGQNDVQSIKGDEVSGNFFSVLGVPAALGRPLTPNDDRNDAPRAVAVISHACWDRRFGADPAVIGKSILIENAPFTVVGVAPAGFFGLDPGIQTEVWIPIQMMPLIGQMSIAQFRSPQSFWLRVAGRLKLGFTPDAAAAELDLLFQSRLADEGFFKAPAWAHVKNFGKMDLLPGGSGYLPDGDRIATLLKILMVVAGFVLVVACANVTGLLLARLVVRQRDLAVRQALGAGRGQIIGQLATESALLATLGGALGLVLAHWGTRILFNFLPGARTLDLSADGRVLLFAILLSGVSAIVVGLIPALRFSRLDLITALKNQAQAVAGGASRRLNRALVTGQIAVSVCLLAGAGLFVHTLKNLQNTDLGFRRKNLLLVNVGLDKNANAIRRAALFKNVVANLEGMSGVRSATFSQGGLLGGALNTLISVDGYTPEPNEQMSAEFSFIGPDFFETLGLPLLKGRVFNEAELNAVPAPPNRATTPSSGPATPGVAIVNATFAQKYFSNIDPIGRIMHSGNGAALRVVGVVQNAVYANLREISSPEYYIPYSPATGGVGARMSFQVRTNEDPLLVGPRIQEAIRGITPKASLSLRTMDDLVDSKLSQERLIAEISSLFSLFALTLACLGLYGMLSYNVTQRTREIGLRMALGARAGNIISLVVRQGVGLALTGCAIGVAAAVALSRYIASSLYGVPAADPDTMAAVLVVLVLVALLACWLPARRATQVDPVIALRAE